jgi:hypothetical protein
MSLPASILKKVSSQVYRQFPEMKGSRPSIQKQGNANRDAQIFLVRYETSVKGANGKSIKRWVRVSVDENGKIIKTSTSR